MTVKVYISGISGNKEVKKRQQRVLLILDSLNVKFEVIDIAEPGNEEKKDFMQNNSTSSGGTISDPSPRHPLPPQIFNDDVYCGDYEQFDLANEIDEMEVFLKIASAPTVTSNAEIKLGNGEVQDSKLENGSSKEDTQEEEKKPEEESASSENQVNEKKEETDDKPEAEDEHKEDEKNEEEKAGNESGDQKAETDSVENGMDLKADAAVPED